MPDEVDIIFEGADELWWEPFLTILERRHGNIGPTHGALFRYFFLGCEPKDNRTPETTWKRKISKQQVRNLLGFFDSLKDLVDTILRLYACGHIEINASSDDLFTRCTHGGLAYTIFFIHPSATVSRKTRANLVPH